MTFSRWTSWKLWLLVPALALAAPRSALALPGNCQGTIFVADAAGGKGQFTDGIAQQITAAQMPLCVQQVNWSTLNEASDFQSTYNLGIKSRQLANKILELKKNNPHAKVYLVGYEAGTSVVLRAAECLPPGSVTHIILVGAAVSCTYDLRPALLTSCEGIDSFYSPNDEHLRHLIRKYGTTDVGVKGATNAAGLVCFHALSNFPYDKAVYCRLRQHAVYVSDDTAPLLVHSAYVHPKFIRTKVLAIIGTSMTNPGAFPGCPVPRQPPPQYPPTPAPQYPTPPAPYSPPPAPQYPPPQYPVPPPPAPYIPPPAPQYPVPQTPSPYFPPPAPQYPTPQTPSPYFPPPAPQYPIPQMPAPYIPPPAPPTPAPTYPPPTPPETPAPTYPPPTAPQTPAPTYTPPPAPGYPLPLPKGSAQACPQCSPVLPSQTLQTTTPLNSLFVRPAILQSFQQSPRP